MGIAILIVIIGSLIYKGKGKIQQVFTKYRNKITKKNEEFGQTV